MNNQTIRQKWEIMKGPTKNPESKNIVIETKMTTNSLQIDHTQLKRTVGSKLGRQEEITRMPHRYMKKYLNFQILEKY